MFGEIERPMYRAVTQMSQLLMRFYVPAVAGAVYVLGVYTWFGRNADIAPLRLAVLASSLTFILSVLLRAVGHRPIVMSLFFLAGLCGGVIVDAVTDLVVNGVDRNMFPIEIAILTAVAVPGFIAGLAVGHGVDYLKQRANRHRVK